MNAVDTETILDARERAARRFAELGYPTTRLEAWKFTNLAPLTRIAWKTPEEIPAVVDMRGASMAGRAAVELVFVNGRFDTHRSHAAAGEVRGLKARNLASVLAAGAELPDFGRYADDQDHAMTALNTAQAEHGAVIEVAEGVAVEGFVHLLFVGTGSDYWSHPRNLILLGRNAQLTLVETFVGTGRYFTNAVSELVVRDGAVLDHTKIIHESDEAYHVGTVQIHQERSSSAASHHMAFGGKLVRNEVNDALTGEGASLTLDGLFVLNEHQHVDNHTVIDHVMPHCDSQELFKGILDGESRGIFDGTIIVRKDAQKTNSRQVNRNLLLSESAIVDSKPTLEIHANDVKCNHGSTIGQLDEEALFYLRARGIGEDEARDLLVYAFASEVVDRLKVPPVAELVRRALFQRLPHRLPERRESTR